MIVDRKFDDSVSFLPCLVEIQVKRDGRNCGSKPRFEVGLPGWCMGFVPPSGDLDDADAAGPHRAQSVCVEPTSDSVSGEVRMYCVQVDFAGIAAHPPGDKSDNASAFLGDSDFRSASR